jgi:hypothetical protein
MATIANTPDSIAAFRLLSLRGRIKLEATGLKFRGGSTRSAIAAEFGLAPRASHDKFLAAIDKKLAELQPTAEVA